MSPTRIVGVFVVLTVCGCAGASPSAQSSSTCAEPEAASAAASNALFEVAETAAGALRSRCERLSIQAFSETGGGRLDASHSIPCDDERRAVALRADATSALEALRRIAEGDDVARTGLATDQLDAWRSCGSVAAAPPLIATDVACDEEQQGGRLVYRRLAFEAWRAAVFHCPGLRDAPGEPPHCPSAVPLVALAIGALEAGAVQSATARAAWGDALAFARQRSRDEAPSEALERVFEAERQSLGCQRAARVTALLTRATQDAAGQRDAERFSIPATGVTLPPLEGLRSTRLGSAQLTVFGGDLEVFVLSAAFDSDDAAAFVAQSGFAPLPGQPAVFTARAGEGARAARGWVRVLSGQGERALLFASFEGPPLDAVSHAVVAWLAAADLDGAVFSPGPGFSLPRGELPIFGVERGDRWLFSAGLRGPESFGVVIGRRDGELNSRGRELCDGVWSLDGEVVVHGAETIGALRGCALGVRADRGSLVLMQLSDGSHRLDIEASVGAGTAVPAAVDRLRTWLSGYSP